MSQKLKGIYDALDHGNFKSCLKLCTAFLQKQPDHALCKALYAVALERCGRRDEALRICEESRSASGVDDTVLNTLQVVYRRCRQFSSISRMYKVASTTETDNEEYAVALFTSALRDGDFDTAQQAATKLYSKHKKPKFLHWIIVTLLLQVRAGGSAKSLNLAAMMLQKAAIDPESLRDREDLPFNRGQFYLLLLHLDALRLQGKQAAALEMLEACKVLVKLPEDMSTLRIQLCREDGQGLEAVAEAKGRVLRSAGDWGAAQDYIRLAFECPAPGSLPTRHCVAAEGSDAAEIQDHGSRLWPSGAIGSTLPVVADMESVKSHCTQDEVWNALLLFKSLQHQAEGKSQQDAGTDSSSSGSSFNCSRTTRLAQLELRRMAFCANEAALEAVVEASAAPQTRSWRLLVSEADWSEFMLAVKEYVARFGHRKHCYFDLKPFLALLDKSETEEVIESALAAGASDVACNQTLARLRQSMNHRIPNGSSTKLELLAQEVYRLLSAAGLCKEQELDTTSSPTLPVSVTEELLLLAIVTLVEMDRLCCQTLPREPRHFLLDAFALADMGAARFPEAFHFRVLLVILHGTFGLASSMLKWYSTLAIKNIQHESLSYLALDNLATFGCQESLRETCRQVLQFHEDVDKDGEQALGMTLQSGVFHRTPEYLEMLKTSSASILWGRAVVEDVLGDCGQAQTWEALVEALSRQHVLVNMVATKPSNFWTMRNQDRSVLSGLCALPHSTPLLAARDHSSQAWRKGGVVPTTLLHSAPTGVVGSSALLWRPLPAGAPDAVDCTSSCCTAKSAVEELIAGGALGAFTPAHLKLFASLLCTVSTLVQQKESKDRKGEEVPDNVSEMLEAARAAADNVLGGDGLEDEGQKGGAEAGAGEEEQKKRNESPSLSPWCDQSSQQRTSLALSVRCALKACDTAYAVLKCSQQPPEQAAAAGQGSSSSWEHAESQLSSLHGLCQQFLEHLRSGGTRPEEGVPRGSSSGSWSSSFAALGDESLPGLWAWLHLCLGIVAPAVLWLYTALPKAGSGKKAKEGRQEALHAARVALKNLATSLQTGLSELNERLSSAVKRSSSKSKVGDDDFYTVTSRLWPQQERSRPEAPQIQAFSELPGLQAQRQQVQKDAAEAHRRHLQSLQEATANRLALLKSRGTFKP